MRIAVSYASACTAAVFFSQRLKAGTTAAVEEHRESKERALPFRLKWISTHRHRCATQEQLIRNEEGKATQVNCSQAQYPGFPPSAKASPLPIIIVVFGSRLNTPHAPITHPSIAAQRVIKIQLCRQAIGRAHARKHRTAWES